MKPINKFEISAILIALVTVTFVVHGSFEKENLRDLLDGQISKLVHQKNGKILISGNFSKTKLLRINSDKSIDWDFTERLMQQEVNRPIHTMAILNDQSIVAGGGFTNFDQSIVGYIAKINSDGSFNSDFARNSGVGFDDVVHDIVALGDGRLIVVGEFTSYNGESVRHIARLLPDGQLDESFSVGEGFDKAPRMAKLSKDGQALFVTGKFQSYQNKKSPFMARIRVADGSFQPYR